MSNIYSRRYILGSSIALLASTTALSRTSSIDDHWGVEFGNFVKGGMAKANVPGLGVAMIRDNRVLFARGYGFADVRRMRPATADTSFHIASISKIVTGTAMMMLLEQGLYQLDDPVNKYLDFRVVHPMFPDTPITFRHLFTHTSGIADDVEDKTPDFSVAGDPTLSLRDFLMGYLTPGGRWYDANGCFSLSNPGTEWKYSNVGVGLLGYLAGRVGTKPLDVFTKSNLFAPLRLTNTAWKIASIRPDHLARPYDTVDDSFHELPPTGYPDWPSGMLRASSSDFARFLTIFTNNGMSDKARYLSPKTLKLFLTDQGVSVAGNPSRRQALLWVLRDMGDEKVAEHGGIDPGATTLASVDPQHCTGALAFANVTGGRPLGSFLREAVVRLHERARTYD